MSYEHVPPRSAFNDCPAVMTPALKLINVPRWNMGIKTGKSVNGGLANTRYVNHAITAQVNGMERLTHGGLGKVSNG